MTVDGCRSACGDAQCVDARHGSRCLCPLGYTGYNCLSDINECDDKLVCSGRGACANSHGSFRCDCDDGYEGTHCHLLVSSFVSSITSSHVYIVMSVIVLLVTTLVVIAVK